MNSSCSKQDRLLSLLVAVVSLFLIFYKLGEGELRSADEAIHAQVSSEMFQDGHWLYPTYRGKPYLEKPPLKFWLTALTYEVGGINEFTARFWSGVFGFLAVLAIMRLGRLMFNPRAGWLSGLVLVSSSDFLFNHCSRTGELDSALLFFLTMGVSELWKSWSLKSERSIPIAAVWFALGFMIKGHMALIPLVWISAMWISAREDPFIPARRSIMAATVLFFLIASPWFILQWIHYGRFYFEYNVHHNLLGYWSGNVEDLHEDRATFYFKRLISTYSPWLAFSILGILLSFQAAVRERFSKLVQARRWLMGWIIVQVVILLSSKARLPWYHLPLLIPLSVFAALCIDHVLAKGSLFNRSWETSWLSVSLLVLLFAPYIPIYFKSLVTRDSVQLTKLTFYYFMEPEEVSVRLASALLPLVTALFILRPYLPDWREFLTKLEIIVVFVVTIFFLWEEIQSPDPSELAQETSARLAGFGKVTKQKIDLYVFDPYSEKAPHFAVPPALYFYAANQEFIHVHNHLETRDDWESLLRNRTDRPIMAVVPSGWLNDFEHPDVWKVVMKVNNSQIVYLPGNGHTFPGS